MNIEKKLRKIKKDYKDKLGKHQLEVQTLKLGFQKIMYISSQLIFKNQP